VLGKISKPSAISSGAEDGRRWYSQYGEDAVVQGFFRARAWTPTSRSALRPSGLYVDVGAHHPRHDSNTFAFYLAGWRGINIDAAPGSRNLFDRERPRDTNMEVAVSDREGPVTLKSWGHSVYNTLSAETADDYVRQKGQRIPDDVIVQARRLDNILSDVVPDGTKIDFLSIDVEGHDLAVLQSNDWARFRPDIVLVEDHHFTLENGTSRPIVTFLSNQQYTLMGWAGPTLLFRNTRPATTG
jgi:FkbM family methyltransferase